MGLGRRIQFGLLMVSLGTTAVGQVIPACVSRPVLTETGALCVANFLLGMRSTMEIDRAVSAVRHEDMWTVYSDEAQTKVIGYVDAKTGGWRRSDPKYEKTLQGKNIPASCNSDLGTRGVDRESARWTGSRGNVGPRAVDVLNWIRTDGV